MVSYLWMRKRPSIRLHFATDDYNPLELRQMRNFFNIRLPCAEATILLPASFFRA